MGNVEIDAPLVNGSLFPIHEKGESCRLAVEKLIGDDLRPPPRSLNLLVHTETGRAVQIVIPYDHMSMAKVFIDGDLV